MTDYPLSRHLKCRDSSIAPYNLNIMKNLEKILKNDKKNLEKILKTRGIPNVKNLEKILKTRGIPDRPFLHPRWPVRAPGLACMAEYVTSH